MTMGSGANYKNGSDTHRWATIGYVGDVKIIADTLGNPDNLPTYSNSSNSYFSRDKNGEISQMRIYDDTQLRRKDPKMDIDIFQTRGHGNKSDNQYFEKDVAHVHEFVKNSKGKFVRKGDARLLTQAEVDKYGQLLRKAFPNVRFRP